MAESPLFHVSAIGGALNPPPVLQGLTSFNLTGLDIHLSVFNYVTNNSDTITITEYTGPGGAVSIPSTIHGLPVTAIAAGAFWWSSSLTSVTVPDSVLDIEGWAFDGLTGLTNITIGNGVASIGDYAFASCSNLTGVFFKGNAPSVGYDVGDNGAVMYFLPGTTGWGPTLASHPTALWLPQVQSSGPSFGVGTNGFGFTIKWTSGTTVVVEATTNLVNRVWISVGTNTLKSDSSYFSDTHWTNYPSCRFYRLRAQ